MTKEKLCRILEEFTMLTISTYKADLTPEDKHVILVEAIEDIANTVMFCSTRRAATTIYN